MSDETDSDSSPLENAWDSAGNDFSDQTVGSSEAPCPYDSPKPNAMKNSKIPRDCAYLRKGGTVEAPKKQFDRIRRKPRLGPGKSITHLFPGDTTPSKAKEYECEIDGKKTTIIMPDPYPVPGKSLPTKEQVANGLAATPPAELEKIDQVVVSPQANPSDAYWAQQYNMPNFKSAATGGEKGVTFYPSSSNTKQPFVDSTMIHEGGHTYSHSVFGDDPDRKKAWEDAMKSDPNSPSEYADASFAEDFAESSVMYALSKNTKCEALARKMYPARYAMLDQLQVEHAAKQTVQKVVDAATGAVEKLFGW